MKKGNYNRYSREFREEAAKMVMEQDLSLMEVARSLNLPESTLRSWVKLYREGNLKDLKTSKQQPLTEVEEELTRVKQELAQVKKERDILKKAAAYFAKESLHGTQ